MKVSMKDIKEKKELKWLRIKGNWTLERLLKKFFVYNGEVTGQEENGEVRIVDSAHVMIVFLPSFNQEKYKLVNGCTAPKMTFDTEMKLVGGAYEYAVILEGEPGVYSTYSIDYFVPLVKTFGKVDRMMSEGYDYPVRIEFAGGVTALLAPRIDAESGVISRDNITFFDVEAWLPEMFGKKKMSANEKISYLYTMDPEITLGKALELMEEMKASTYKKIDKQEALKKFF